MVSLEDHVGSHFSHLKTMKSLSKTTESFAEICFLASSMTCTIGIKTSKMYTARHAELYIASTSSPPTLLVGNVVLHACVHVDLEFDLLHRTSEAWIELSGIIIIGVVFGIVDVLFRSVDTKTFFSNLEFLGSIAKREEAQNPDLEMLESNLVGAHSLLCFSRLSVNDQTRCTEYFLWY